jgi:hypothetical protein
VEGKESTSIATDAAEPVAAPLSFSFSELTMPGHVQLLLHQMWPAVDRNTGSGKTLVSILIFDQYYYEDT